MDSKYNIDDLLIVFYEKKVARDKAQSEYDSLRTDVMKFMNKMGKDVLLSKKHMLTSSIRPCTRETVSKKNLPSELWERYKTVSNSSMLTLKKVKPPS